MRISSRRFCPLVVDDGIVVTENIFKMKQRGTVDQDQNYQQAIQLQNNIIKTLTKDNSYVESLIIEITAAMDRVSSWDVARYYGAKE